MSEDTLDKMISGYMSTRQPQYSFGWQGGEPTLMGLDFFQRAVELQKKYGQSGVSVSNGLQTNGILINDEFARFLAKYNFLVGVSLDGPEYIHNHYRKYKGGGDTHADVLKAIKCLKRHNVEFNILVLVNKNNVDKAGEIYHFLCDNGLFFHQYIECVEFDKNGKPLPYSVTSELWGKFLCDIYDEWKKSDTRKVSIRSFDSLLNYLVSGTRNVCKMGMDCRQYFVVEYNGDVFPCDFFVEKELKIGNVSQGNCFSEGNCVSETNWDEFRESKIYKDFGKMKTEWNKKCGECEYIAYCAGDCLKSRFYFKRDPEQISWLCKGWEIFYEHALPGLRELAREIHNERTQSENMRPQAAMPAPLNEHTPQKEFIPQIDVRQKKIGRNDPCPCNSGKKYKNCCLGLGPN